MGTRNYHLSGGSMELDAMGSNYDNYRRPDAGTGGVYLESCRERERSKAAIRYAVELEGRGIHGSWPEDGAETTQRTLIRIPGTIREIRFLLHNIGFTTCKSCMRQYN